ncbi:hypothetical protein SODALDRAFT_360677 [Sodiomyces alkalinus F11]|uniref:Uncharacterized protein n=1 Tax=Sodiomyces alkalinus (strain CBS 110278 / VKM F-3762 / F11) TaxID=1314773 RepID=A0A3N2PV12_SODAK|nr:hypothetical protein SODALDRAFT_360677 [Sodiomyces alkalinus F11]ROT38318.1 hypothetical protein SODALDRAFT_360677 [Sodiomyces alkalinus F11]
MISCLRKSTHPDQKALAALDLRFNAPRIFHAWFSIKISDLPFRPTNIFASPPEIDMRYVRSSHVSQPGTGGEVPLVALPDKSVFQWTIAKERIFLALGFDVVPPPTISTTRNESLDKRGDGVFLRVARTPIQPTSLVLGSTLGLLLARLTKGVSIWCPKLGSVAQRRPFLSILTRLILPAQPDKRIVGEDNNFLPAVSGLARYTSLSTALYANGPRMAGGDSPSVAQHALSMAVALCRSA